jgi:hypothetical protein
MSLDRYKTRHTHYLTISYENLDSGEWITTTLSFVHNETYSDYIYDVTWKVLSKCVQCKIFGMKILSHIEKKVTYPTGPRHDIPFTEWEEKSTPGPFQGIQHLLTVKYTTAENPIDRKKIGCGEMELKFGIEWGKDEWEKNLAKQRMKEVGIQHGDFRVEKHWHDSDEIVGFFQMSLQGKLKTKQYLEDIE